MAKIEIYDEYEEKTYIIDTMTDCAVCGKKHNIKNAQEGEVCESCFFDRRSFANPAW